MRVIWPDDPIEVVFPEPWCILKCPECGYTAAIEHFDVLGADWGNVIGADWGNVICTQCYHEGPMEDVKNVLDC
jgi:hypothetical protein